MNKILMTVLMIITLSTSSIYACEECPKHEMQHGFIISDDDQFFSHLVATGHHSHQLSLSAELSFLDGAEKNFYLKQKQFNVPFKKTYFLFQAQKLDLPRTKVGQVLSGHIIESDLGNYNPGNVIVRNVEVKIKAIHVNIPNPFFTKE